jgi:hypothetical protein
MRSLIVIGLVLALALVWFRISTRAEHMSTAAPPPPIAEKNARIATVREETRKRLAVTPAPILPERSAIGQPDPRAEELDSTKINDPYDSRPEMRDRYQRFIASAELSDGQQKAFDNALRDIGLMYIKGMDVPGGIHVVEGEAFDRMRSLLTLEQWAIFERVIGVQVLGVAFARVQTRPGKVHE